MYRLDTKAKREPKGQEQNFAVVAISSINLINDPPSLAGPFIKTVTTDGFPQVNSYLQPTVNSRIQTELWTCVQSAVFTKTILNLST